MLAHRQTCHFCFAKLWFNITAITVSLRSVPKNTPKYAQVGSHVRASADSRNTPNTSVFSPDAHADTYSTGWPCHCISCCVLGKSSSRATEHILHCCCCRATSYQNIIKKTNKRRKPGIWCHTSTSLLFLQQQKTCMATVQETANSSAWNIFIFQRQGPPRRRARKLLSLCPTHGSAHTCLANNWTTEKNGARAEVRNILQEKFRGGGASSCRFDRRFETPLPHERIIV